MGALLLGALLAGGCSDPVYYPESPPAFAGAGDTAAPDNSPAGIDLSGLPCGPATPGPLWLFTVDNRHSAPVVAHTRAPDCALVAFGTIDSPQVFDASAHEGEVLVFTDEAVSVVLAWAEVAPNDATTVVIP